MGRGVDKGEEEKCNSIRNSVCTYMNIGIQLQIQERKHIVQNFYIAIL
jgi:hypothetical protein